MALLLLLRHMLSPVRPSTCPSVTRVNQSKTFEVHARLLSRVYLSDIHALLLLILLFAVLTVTYKDNVRHMLLMTGQ